MENLKKIQYKCVINILIKYINEEISRVTQFVKEKSLNKIIISLDGTIRISKIDLKVLYAYLKTFDIIILNKNIIISFSDYEIKSYSETFKKFYKNYK